jgi:molecular chaperone GrpE
MNQEIKKQNKLKEKKQDVEKLIKDFQEIEKMKNDYLAGWQRARADFLNYKKEEMERIQGLLKYSQEEFILKILPVLDSFDLAEKNLSENLKDDETVKGLLQIKIQLKDFLKNQNLEEIKSVGEKFNPEIHEAVEQIELDQEKESGVIIEEVQKGYKINNRLLRPAKVKVTK